MHSRDIYERERKGQKRRDFVAVVGVGVVVVWDSMI